MAMMSFMCIVYVHDGDDRDADPFYALVYVLPLTPAASPHRSVRDCNATAVCDTYMETRAFQKKSQLRDPSQLSRRFSNPSGVISLISKQILIIIVI